jgi:acetoacetyl-CoA synthetase
MVTEGELLWTPSREFAQASNVAAFMRWLRQRRGLDFADYDALWRWSVADIGAFWTAVWDYFGVQSDAPYRRVVSEGPMFGARWFEGSRVNYAEHMLRHAEDDGVVFHHESELRPRGTTRWRDLSRAVRVMATQLRRLGIVPGDRVVAYMPNIEETAVAMMATAAVGAVWSSAAPEFGVKTVVERFAQIRPKLIFVADGYRFGGRDFDRGAEIGRIVGSLDSLQHVVFLPYLEPARTAAPVPDAIAWSELAAGADPGPQAFRFERVPHDHPLWVVFSSGTTGLPKAIAHSHVGVLLEHFKVLSFHVGLGPGSCLFFYTTTGWMMWNILLGALLTRSAVVLYDGHPTHPGPEALWRIAADAGATCFGASPTFVQIMQKNGVKPRERFDLSRLTTVLLSGSPASPETFAWFYEQVKSDLWLTSQSGGTEICSGFVGASPTLPVYAGEIQTRMLGMDVHAWSDRGEDLVDEVGELVVTQPFPSMPIYFWNDEGSRRYRESYFEVFDGVWRHGDFLKINRRGGCFIYGRSDSTLNRYGVRIGTAEIYRAIERIEQVRDGLIVCCELPGGSYFMPLFVQLQPGCVLDEALQARIQAALRVDCSPRHVPDRIVQVDAVPYTLTGKKMEIPVRKILMGAPLEKVASRDAMMNPGALDWFVQFAQHAAIR